MIRRSTAQNPVGWLLTLSLLVPLVAFVWVDLTPRAHLVLSFVLMAVGIAISRLAPQFRMVLMVLSVCASSRYLLWRYTESMNWSSTGDTVASLALISAETYAFISLLLGYFQLSIQRRRTPVPLGPFGDDLPSVDVFLPTYNESPDVLRPTILGAMAMDYPNKKIWVLDDGRRETIRNLAHELGCGYLTRSDNKGAKAGNLNAAMTRTSGELIAIFDADHVPVRGFLQATVGFFLNNTKLALVQTPHHFYNADPFERNLGIGGQVPPEQHLFYHGVQLGNDFWNAAFFCGSCAVLRRAALVENGGICTETVTEDAHTALRLHAAGWDSVFYDVPLAAGLATESYADHVGQRIRWARGMAQIFRLDNPLTKKGLSIPQRITYFSAAWHFFYGLPRLIYMVTPALYLLLNLHPLDADVREVLMYAVPHLVLLFLGTESMHRNLRHSFWPEVYEVSMAAYAAAVTTTALFAPDRGSFNVTAKGSLVDEYRFDWDSAKPLVVLVGLISLAVLATPWKLQLQPLDHEPILIAAAWNVYNLLLVVAAMMTAYERPQRRKHHRIKRECRVRPLMDGPLREGSTVDMSMSGLSFFLPGTERLPEFVALQLSNNHTTTPSLPFVVIGQWLVDNQLHVRGQFDPLDPDQQAGLSTIIFSDSDGWSNDAYAQDSILRSWVMVFVAAFFALIRKPHLTQRLMKPQKAILLVDLRGPVTCEACTKESTVATGSCEWCGAALFYPSQPSFAEASRKRPTWAGAVTPITLMFLGIALALGWSPLVQALNVWVPVEQGHDTCATQRKAELRSAYHDLSSLHAELAHTLTAHRLPRRDFSDDLASLQTDFKLYGDPSRCLGCEHWEAALHTALMTLGAAETELRSGLSQEILDARMRRAAAALAEMEPSEQ
jgi:cellulose synthase (UDP-forming)